MDLNTGLIVAAGVVVLAGGGAYRWWLWHRQFRAPKVRPELEDPPVVAVKAKRKYTRKPKVDPTLAQKQQQQMQEPKQPESAWPFPTRNVAADSERLVNGHDREQA